MKNKHLLSLVTALALLMITAISYSQNVGIGQNAPLSKLDVKGNLVVGADYSGTSAPINGAIIEGNVGIGTTSASALLTIGTSSPVTVDNIGNVTISSLSGGSIVVTGAGGLLQVVTAPELANTYLQWNGSAYIWASASASLANLTAGTGLSGSVYNGSTAQTWSVNYGSTTGTAVQGNTQITVSPGTGMSGGGAITLGSGGTVTLNNTGVISLSVTSPIVNSGTSTAPNISLGTVGVANGGTGLTSLTADAILYASGTATVGQLADVAAGSYLRSAGTASAPVWSTLTLPNAATTGDILYATGTNTIGNLSDVATGDVLISGGTGVAPSWGQIGLTTGVTGILPVVNGGTGDNTLTSKGILYGNGTGAVSVTAAGNQGQILTVNSSGIPVWTTATYPATTTINQVLFSSATNTVTGITAANNGVLTTSSTGVPSWLAPGTDGYVLTLNSSGAPTWASASAGLANLTASTGLTGSAYNGSTAQSWSVSYGSTAGTAVQGNTSLTVTAGTDLTGGGTVTLGSGGTITLNVGTIGVANGGTGDNTLTSKGILYGNGTAAVGITAAGNQGQILTVNSSGIPVWTTATYPATTTINQLLYSSATNTVTGITAANNGVLTTSSTGVPSWLAAGTNGQVLTISSGTPTWATSTPSLATLTPSTGLSGSAYNGSTAQSWTVSYGSTAGTAVQGNTSLTVTAGTDLTGGGTVTLGSGGTITLNVGTVGVANGGTGDNTLTSKGILYGNGTGAVNVTAAGSTGEILTVNTSGIPVWTTATYPATTTINQLLYSSGTNTVTGLTTANDAVLTTSSSGVPSWLAAGTSGQVLTMSSSGVPSWSTSSSSGTNYWALSGSNLYPTSTTYNVGVGTNSPNTQLDVDGDFAMRKYGGATPSTSFITVTGGGSYTLNPQGYSFVELQASSAFTLTNIDGGENGKVLVVWCSSNGMMSIASTGNIQTYTSGTMSPTSSQMTMGTFIYDVRSSQWILIAYQ